MTALLNPSDIHEATIIVHAIATSGVSYARDLSGTVEGQIFVPQGITRRFDMRPGDTFKARVAPNFADRQETVPWRLIYVDMANPPEPVAKPAPPAPVVQAPAPKLTKEQVKVQAREEALDGRVWTTREMFNHIFGREPVFKNEDDKAFANTISNALRAMSTEGLLYRLELYKTSEIAHAVYFCSDIDALKPEGF